jgi:hypothetical protein
MMILNYKKGLFLSFCHTEITDRTEILFLNTDFTDVTDNAAEQHISVISVISV